ncbi:MAG: hypothetical protein H7839_04875 [Magnetococcus sp. YQC-5]
MKIYDRPREPRSCLSRVQVKAFDAEATKASGWNSQGILVVAKDDHRLNWVEREMVRQLGEKLYGRGQKEKRHG